MMKKVFILLGLVILLTGCSGGEYGGYYASDFERVSEWDALEELGYDNPVLVYQYDKDFLGGYNLGSEEVNADVFTFGKENNIGLELHVLNRRTADGSRPPYINPLNPTQLLLFYEGDVAFAAEGGTPVLRFLEDLNSDDYILPGSRGMDIVPEDFDTLNAFESWESVDDYDEDFLLYIYEQEDEGDYSTGTLRTVKPVYEHAMFGPSDIPFYTVNINDLTEEVQEELDANIPRLQFRASGTSEWTVEGSASILVTLELLDGASPADIDPEPSHPAGMAPDQIEDE